MRSEVSHTHTRALPLLSLHSHCTHTQKPQQARAADARSHRIGARVLRRHTPTRALPLFGPDASALCALALLKRAHTHNRAWCADCSLRALSTASSPRRESALTRHSAWEAVPL
eukprot:6283827-Prymnesium_polylepis.1